MQKLKNQVEEILRDFPEARNSDIRLMIELWKKFYPNQISFGEENFSSVYLGNLYDLPRESAIGRIRRYIQNDESRTAEMRYLPTSKEVARQRGINEAIWFLAMGSKIN
jgi:hypothetical protein